MMHLRVGARWGGLAAVSALLASGCGGGQQTSTSTKSATATVACDTQGSASTASTASYSMVLVVGPLEEMVSADQNPTSGELMLAGAMSDASGPDAQHLEVHICSRATGAVVTGASPSIAIVDSTAGSAPQNIAVAAMQGVTSGQNDLHYGNNVVLPHGHSFTITVTLNGEKATLDLRRP